MIKKRFFKVSLVFVVIISMMFQGIGTKAYADDSTVPDDSSVEIHDLKKGIENIPRGDYSLYALYETFIGYDAAQTIFKYGASRWDVNRIDEVTKEDIYNSDDKKMTTQVNNDKESKPIQNTFMNEKLKEIEKIEEKYIQILKKNHVYIEDTNPYKYINYPIVEYTVRNNTVYTDSVKGLRFFHTTSSSAVDAAVPKALDQPTEEDINSSANDLFDKVGNTVDITHSTTKDNDPKTTVITKGNLSKNDFEKWKKALSYCKSESEESYKTAMDNWKTIYAEYVNSNMQDEDLDKYMSKFDESVSANATKGFDYAYGFSGDVLLDEYGEFLKDLQNKEFTSEQLASKYGYLPLLSNMAYLITMGYYNQVPTPMAPEVKDIAFGVLLGYGSRYLRNFHLGKTKVEIKKIKIPVTVKWNTKDGDLPLKQITVDILNDRKEKVDSITVSSSDNWKGSFNVPIASEALASKRLLTL